MNLKGRGNKQSWRRKVMFKNLSEGASGNQKT